MYVSAFAPVFSRQDSALNVLLSVTFLRGESLVETPGVSPRTSGIRASIRATKASLTSRHESQPLPPLIPSEIWQFAASGARTTTKLCKHVGSMESNSPDNFLCSVRPIFCEGREPNGAQPRTSTLCGHHSTCVKNPAVDAVSLDMSQLILPLSVLLFLRREISAESQVPRRVCPAVSDGAREFDQFCVRVLTTLAQDRSNVSQV